jgi:hypothetical protein
MHILTPILDDATITLIRAARTDWSEETRVAVDAPPGMTKWGWAGAGVHVTFVNDRVL